MGSIRFQFRRDETCIDQALQGFTGSLGLKRVFLLLLAGSDP